jgi:hypothetical protein
MLRSIQFFIQNNHLKIKMPSSWWKRITAFLFVHKVIKQLKKNKF